MKHRGDKVISCNVYTTAVKAYHFLPISFVKDLEGTILKEKASSGKKK